MNSDSPLFKFKTELAQGSEETVSFIVNDIGTLTNVLLSIDSTDAWRFASVTVQVDESYIMLFDDSLILRSDTTASVWLQRFFLFFFFFFFFFKKKYSQFFFSFLL